MRSWKKCASLLLVLAGKAGAQPPCDFGLDVGGQHFRAEVANTAATRELGLSGRDRLAEDAGMWFDLEQTGMPGFWMRGMRFPIDLIWVNPEHRVLGMATLPVCTQEPCPITYPPAPVAYVLEVGAQRFLGRVGERVEGGCR